ncbi:ABC transporter permease [Actinomadura sp. DC4]|uniref:ABC transporter permease n=1 Tax=Actinomadura sp. DC4 TaxID=3055069 RepID=UPI0025B06DB1|nr:ABC transporter permease [Actinomadura sp. DC4]MDN3356462.1 ABC transporter permease [Actinomadura sp. DC4]
MSSLYDGRRLSPARLGPRDVFRVGLSGLRARPTRVVLSALGIAIGIATMVAVIGISSSSKERLLSQLDTLGTNLLTVEPGQTLFGTDAKLPETSVAMARRIGSVTTASAVGKADTSVRRTDLIPVEDTSGIAVQAATGELLTTLDGTVRTGSWLSAATERYPAVVLGWESARRLGVTRVGAQVWISDRWFTVVGILNSLPLAPEIDRSALVGWDAATRYLGFDGHPTTLYERSKDEAVEAVRDVLPRTVSPENPEEVKVSRPSDALAAKAAAAGAFTNLLLGLGAVALLVGGVGVANTMVISVLERRREIGLRRSLGATRGQVRTQFLSESLLLSALGGVAGALLGSLFTVAFAAYRGWPPVVPSWALAGGVAATLVIGTIAGIYPAMRAARLSPTVALTTT